MKTLYDPGYFIYEDVIPHELINQLGADLLEAIDYCNDIQRRNGVGQYSETPLPSLAGAAHHILPLSDSFTHLLTLLTENKPLITSIEEYLGGAVILNNYGGFCNDGKSDYGHGLSIHRDVREEMVSIGKSMVIIMVSLDDFTLENGATYILPNSEKTLEKPSDSYFKASSARAICKKGSLITFDASLWHSAGKNHTGEMRRALTIGFTRPYIKPQFDYCNSMPEGFVKTLPEATKKIIGYYSRTPKTHSDWYQAPEKRFYQVMN